MASSSRCPPWVRENPDQQGLVSRSQMYSQLLQKNMQELCNSIIIVGLWVYLISLGVIDTTMKRNLEESHPTNEDQVYALIEYLLRSPCWKLHAFIRALCKADQGAVVSQILLLNPQDYEGEEEVQDQATHKKQLKKEIKSHRDVYHRTLMTGRLFDIPSLDLPYDMEPCIVEVVATSDELLRNPEKILPADILKPKPGKPKLKTVLLTGPPGAGKSTFIRYYVYKWCQTESGKSDWDLIIILNVSTLSLTPGLSPADHIKEAIRQSLEGRGDKEAIMKSLDDDSLDILIIPDGMDECRSDTILKMLNKLISGCYGGKLGFTVLSTCRSGLSQIKDTLFDKRVKIDGFTREEGIKYVERFYKEIQKPDDDAMYGYIANSQGKLDHILTNPLCVHILSIVTADGTLKLRKGQRLLLKTLFQAMEKSMKRRQLEKNETQVGKALTRQELEDQTRRFYNMSLYALLTDVRIFTQSLLDKFQISDQNPYLTFMTKKKNTHMYQQTEGASQWTYNHEVFHEYFSARALQTLPEDLRSALLLTIASSKEFRNTQKIMFSDLGLDVDHLGTLSDMICVNLITQSKFRAYDPKLIDVCYDVRKKIKASPDLHALLDSLIPGTEDARTVDTGKAKVTLQRIRHLYENETELLQRSGYFFVMNKDVFLFSHIYECIREVPEEHQQLVFDQSLGRILPSMWYNRGNKHFMYKTGGMRWALVSEYMGTDVEVNINHSLTDASEAIRQYGQQHLATFMRDKEKLNEVGLNFAVIRKETSMDCGLNEIPSDGMTSVWGDPAHDQILSITPWSDLISDLADWQVTADALDLIFGMETDDGGLAYSPLNGFLQCLQMERTKTALRKLLVQDRGGRLRIKARHGHIDSDSLLAWTEWYLQQDLLQVQLTELTCRTSGEVLTTRQDQKRSLENLQHTAYKGCPLFKDLFIDWGDNGDGEDSSDGWYTIDGGDSSDGSATVRCQPHHNTHFYFETPTLLDHMPQFARFMTAVMAQRLPPSGEGVGSAMEPGLTTVTAAPGSAVTSTVSNAVPHMPLAQQEGGSAVELEGTHSASPSVQPPEEPSPRGEEGVSAPPP